MFNIKMIKGLGVKRTDVDVLKYPEKIGALIAFDTSGGANNYTIKEYQALINLGGGDSPYGETEGGIWAITGDGKLFWIHHTALVYEINAEINEEV